MIDSATGRAAPLKSKADTFGDALAGPAAADDERVDANDLTLEIDQRSAGIAVVDGGVGLDQILHAEARLGLDRTAGGADNAGRDGVGKVAQRRTDGDDGVPRSQRRRIPPRGDARAGGV